MGHKLLWLGLTLIMTNRLLVVPVAEIVGEVLMLIGCVLYLLNV